MFTNNFSKKFNSLCGPLNAGMCRLTLNGDIAVKCSNGYKFYNVAKGTLTNVDNFCFDLGSEMFFVVPTRKVKVGDLVLIGQTPKCVTTVDKKVITVIDYESSEVKQIIPERHLFMGNSYYYGKIYSMFGSGFKKDKSVSNIMKMMVFSQMMGGANNNDNGINNRMSGMGQMMAMSMFMGGKDNPFDGMFDFDLDDDEEEEIEEETDKEEEK